MQPIAQVAPPPTKEQLIEQLKDTITDLVRNDVAGDVEPEKIWQFRMARKNDLYWRQLQYVSPHLFEGGLVDFSSIGSPIAGSEAQTGSGLYDYVQNIYRGHGRKYIAVLGQRSPNVKAVADDPDDESKMKATRMADTAAQILRAQWNADQRNLELMLHLWKSGTTFAYTPWVVNGYKYGKTEEPKIEVRLVPIGEAGYQCVNCGAKTPESQLQNPTCPQCKNPLGGEDRYDAETMDVPAVVGTSQYENGACELHLLNIMFVSVPFFTQSLEDTPWLAYEYEEYKGRLLQAYQKLRDDNLEYLGGDTAGSEIGAVTRDSAASPMGIPTPHRASRWNYKRIWFKPEMYELVKDDGKRQMLYQNFPDGMKATLVQGKPVDLENEKLTDVWSCCKPETSEYIFADPAGQDLVPIQDLVNDIGINIPAETLERGLGITFVDQRIIDMEQWESHQSTPAEIMPVMPGGGASIGDSFFQSQPTRFSEQALPWIQSVEAQAQQVIGIVPEIFGGGNAPTARQAEMNKNAALMQLGTTWLYVRKFWEATYTNGVKCLARHGAGTIRGSAKSGTGYQSLVLNMSELQDSGWHFEAEESIPMTWGQQRDLLMFMMEKPLPVLQAFGFMHPMNIQKNQELLGMTGYLTPGVDQVEKTLEVIKQLAQQKPIVKPNPDGSPGIPQPSVPPDQYEDDHNLASQTVQAYCNTMAGRQLRESNPDGYANVVAYGKAQLAMATPPPPPPPAPPAPKLSVSAKVGDMPPGEANEVLQHFGVLGAAPPPPPVQGPAPGAPPPPPGPPSPGPAPAGGAPIPPGGPPQVAIPPGGPGPAPLPPLGALQ